MIRCDPSAKFCFGGKLIVVKKLQKKDQSKIFLYSLMLSIWWTKKRCLLPNMCTKENDFVDTFRKQRMYKSIFTLSLALRMYVCIFCSTRYLTMLTNCVHIIFLAESNGSHHESLKGRYSY